MHKLQDNVLLLILRHTKKLIGQNKIFKLYLKQILIRAWQHFKSISLTLIPMQQLTTLKP